MKSPIRPSARKANTTVKQHKIGDRHVLLHSAGNCMMHHSGFIDAVLLDSNAEVHVTLTSVAEEW